MLHFWLQMFIGCFIGAAVWGWMNDNFGRRYPLFIATALIAAATLASTASPSYWFLAATRALAGIGGAGQSQCIVLICAETTGPAYRCSSGQSQAAADCRPKCCHLTCSLRSYALLLLNTQGSAGC